MTQTNCKYCQGQLKEFRQIGFHPICSNRYSYGLPTPIIEEEQNNNENLNRRAA